MKTLAGILIFAALAISASGCTPVAAWERGALARPEMAPDPNPLQSELRDHIHESREGASSGPSAKGGGCGCY